MEKSADAFRTISEVADELKLPQHVLRFWETRFTQVRPLKRGGNRRFYRPDDVELLLAIKKLLYEDGFTIKGVQRILKDRGPRAVAGLARSPNRRAELAPSHSPTADEESESRGGGFDADGGEALSAEDFAMSPELADRLQAVLFEVSECRRILAAVRE